MAAAFMESAKKDLSDPVYTFHSPVEIGKYAPDPIIGTAGGQFGGEHHSGELASVRFAEEDATDAVNTFLSPDVTEKYGPGPVNGMVGGMVEHHSGELAPVKFVAKDTAFNVGERWTEAARAG